MLTDNNIFFVFLKPTRRRGRRRGRRRSGRRRQW
jgi:hypothetical protein